MHFCPICQANYEEENICPVCHGELITGDYRDMIELLSSEKEEFIFTLYNKLCEDGFSSIQYYYVEEENRYLLFCDFKEEALCKKAIDEFLSSDSSISLSDARKDEFYQMLSGDEAPKDHTGSYVFAKDRYEDMFSTSMSFFFVCIVGILLEIFSILPDMIHLTFYNICATVLFLMGIIALIKAMQIKSTIPQEEAKKERVLNYFETEYHYSPSAETNVDDGEIYFLRTDDMKKKALENFPEIDPRFLDALLDIAYATVFQEES